MDFPESVGIVKLVLLKLWESGNREAIFQGRFLPVFSTAFDPPIGVHFSPFSPRCLRIDSRASTMR